MAAAFPQGGSALPHLVPVAREPWGRLSHTPTSEHLLAQHLVPLLGTPDPPAFSRVVGGSPAHSVHQAASSASTLHPPSPACFAHSQ